jgi:hypothetical protein
MTVSDRYRQYQDHGYAAVIAQPVEHADELFYLALLAFGENDAIRAAQFAGQAAAREPANLVYAAAATYLERVAQAGTQSVYLSPEAFSAFIRGGSNVPLYEATSTALRQAYTQDGATSLLDIGVGDGLALLPALTPAITKLDLVEPSAALLDATSARLSARGIAHRAFNQTLQDFVATARESWDIIQATFSLQSIAPTERTPLLAWMRDHGRRVLIAEFDEPHFAGMYAPDRLEYVVDHFQRGLAEYAGDGGLVAQGFLMPVLFGYFDKTAARTNYEQPVREWVDQLRTAGFVDITTTQLFPYWWAPAFLISAH